MDLEAIIVKAGKLCHWYCDYQELWKCCQMGCKSGESLSPSGPQMPLWSQANRRQESPELRRVLAVSLLAT